MPRFALLPILILSRVGGTRGGGAPESPRPNIPVIAGASIAAAFAEVGAALGESHPPTGVTINLAGPEHHRARQGHGAEGNAFASRSQSEPDEQVTR